MTNPNHLISESSPYLLQHAYNPVAWYPWSEDVLELAKKENKLILVSIGYSACHWCHVMERESFEDEATAVIMNERFICIKIDREERPDIDQVYMHAVQLISGQGGWPLNCFTLPDGRPLYGGTYFRNEQWKEILINLSDLYKNDPEKVDRYAKQLTEGVQQSEIVGPTSIENAISPSDTKEMVEVWSERFDKEDGGTRRAPKFPLPNNWQFLLRYGAAKSESILNHVKLTLDKMAMGGIYDQLGGGFARYATDSYWKVPHFEKMLYDNAQLVELYSEAYQLTQSPLYSQTVRETLKFIERELTSPEGLFFSALDADSEGVEGKFYVWTKEELAEILGDDYSLFSEAYSVNSIGYWEEGNYILVRKNSDAELAGKADLPLGDWQQKISNAKKKLFVTRSKRIRPGLDDKILVSWNAMMVKGYVAAYTALGERDYLNKAIQAAQLLITKGKRNDGGLFRIPNSGKNASTRINGFLEDYALVIDALIALYQATFSEVWLTEARALMEYVLLHFQDPTSSLFYFTSNLDKPLVARKMELMDNVMPSSNSVMAKNLFILGRILEEEKYLQIAKQMFQHVKAEMPKYGSGYSNWAQLAQYLSDPFYEVVITGPNSETLRLELAAHFLPNKILLGTSVPSSLPLFRDRFSTDRTQIFVCKNKTCELPVASVSEALLLLSR